MQHVLLRHVVNGEILGVSLLLEDVLQAGLPELFFSKQEDADNTSVMSATPRSRPTTGTSRREMSRHSESVDDGINESQTSNAKVFDIPKGSLSISRNPKAAVKLVNMFLLICSRLEILKTDWSCRKLGTNEICTTAQYRKFWYGNVGLQKFILS